MNGHKTYLIAFDDGVEVVVSGSDAVLEAVAVASPYDIDCVVVLVDGERAGRWRTGGWSVDAFADWLVNYPHAPLRLNAVANRGGRLWFEGGRVADMPHREARHHRDSRVTLLPEDDDDAREPMFEVRYE